MSSRDWQNFFRPGDFLTYENIAGHANNLLREELEKATTVYGENFDYDDYIPDEWELVRTGASSHSAKLIDIQELPKNLEEKK